MKSKFFLILFISGFISNSFAGNPEFCRKISGHAESIMNSRFDGNISQNELLRVFENTPAKPYFSSETNTWLKRSVNEAFKNKWSPNSYQVPESAPYNPNAKAKNYAMYYFTKEIYEKCVNEAPSNSAYCSKQILQDARDSNKSKLHRAKINGLCS